MKKILLPFFLLLALTACNNNSEKKSDTTKDTTVSEAKESAVIERTLIGNWKPIKVEPLKADGMDEKDRKEILDSMTVEFRANGTFSSSMKGETKGGTYMFSEQDGKLITKQDNGREETLQITWDGNNMVLKDENVQVTLKRL